MFAAALVVAAVTAACGNGAAAPGGSHGTYPLVSGAEPAMQPPTTLSNGSVVRLPAVPTSYRVDPSPSCERAAVSVPESDGSFTQKDVVIPPAPGLRAEAVTDHTVKLTWWFDDVPTECRPSSILVSIRAGTDPTATPLTKTIQFTGDGGSAELTYPAFLKPPDVALASTTLPNGLRSRVVSVLIRQ
jgi:hypothetical protein